MAHNLIISGPSRAVCGARDLEPGVLLERTVAAATSLAAQGRLNQKTVSEVVRSTLLMRLDRLALALAPCGLQKIPAILAELDGMIDRALGSEAQAIAQAKLDLRDLEGLPEFALRDAVRAFRRGARGEGRFRPTAGEIRIEALRRVEPFARERLAIEALKLDQLPEAAKPVEPGAAPRPRRGDPQREKHANVKRPLLRWHGGKWRIAPWLISLFPPHRAYVEPYGGAASVLLRKPAIGAECFNDLDGTVVNVFRVLRDPAKAAELERRLRLTPFAREEFDLAYAPATDAIDAAHKTIVLSFMGYGSDSASRSCRTGFRTKRAKSSLPAREWSSYADAIPDFTRRLMGTVIENSDAFTIISRFDEPGTLFYLDPPYMHATRSSLAGHSKKVHGYAHEMDDNSHLALLAALRQIKGMAVLSGYPTVTYDLALKGWERRECRTHAADSTTPRTEVAWLNPAAIAAGAQRDLFDERGAGSPAAHLPCSPKVWMKQAKVV